MGKTSVSTRLPMRMSKWPAAAAHTHTHQKGEAAGGQPLEHFFDTLKLEQSEGDAVGGDEQVEQAQTEYIRAARLCRTVEA